MYFYLTFTYNFGLSNLIMASQREYEGLVKVFGEEKVAHLKPQEDAKPENTQTEAAVTEESKNDAPAATADTPKQETTKTEVPQFTEEQIFAFIKEKTGRDIKSFDELSDKPDPSVEAEKREQDKIAYALSNGLITKKQYEDYISDKANPSHSVYAEFAKELREEDASLTDEDIKDQFNEEFALDADSESAKYKRGQKKLAALSEKYIQDNHKDYFSIEGKYSEHEKSTKESVQKANLIKEKTPAYKKAIEDAFASKSKIEVSIGEAKYQVEIEDKDVQDIKDSFLSKELREQHILSGVSDQDLASAVSMAIREKHFGKIVESLSAKRLEEQAKGTHGVPRLGELRRDEGKKSVLSEKELKYFKATGLIPDETNIN